MRSGNIAGCIAFTAAFLFLPLTQQVQAQCLADLNHNHTVDGADITLLMTAWNTSGGSQGADINLDGIVDGVDLALILSAWGACPGPAWATVLEWAPNASVVTNTTLRNAITASGWPWRVKDIGTNIEMVLIPSGTFWMGCSSGDPYCSVEELPVHQITLTNAFYMSRTEVTQAQWLAKMGSNPSYFQPPYATLNTQRPVDQVSWNMIQNFNTATGFRFPTEAEWEYACRAGTTASTYGFLGNIAWHYPISSDSTHPVATKLPNALGLYDTIGNVWEWCQDWYDNSYYASSPSVNPPGPTGGEYVVLRGGGYGTFNYTCRASTRLAESPNAVWRDEGFRAVKNP